MHTAAYPSGEGELAIGVENTRLVKPLLPPLYINIVLPARSMDGMQPASTNVTARARTQRQRQAYVHVHTDNYKCTHTQVGQDKLTTSLQQL